MARMSPEIAQKALGLKNGKLAVCPQDMKNCVCTEYQDNFTIAPLVGSSKSIWDSVKTVVSAEAGYELQSSSEDYLHFTHKSKLMGFIDDVEFRLESKGKKFLVHCRSASRLGYWDLGANRKRVQTLFKKIEGAADQAHV